MAHIVETMYPSAKRITLVMDNLSAHRIHNLYKVFEPERARAIRDRLEIVYTPKHGSWLNIAECELNVLSRQALKQRFASKDELEKQVQAWATLRNDLQKGVDWQFTTNNARVKLKKSIPDSIKLTYYLASLHNWRICLFYPSTRTESLPKFYMKGQ
ncbi:MAG: transposase [Arenicella sp.]|jgi:transposase